MEEAGECPASRAHGGCFWEAPGAPPVLTTPRGAEELGPGLHVAVEPRGQSLPACSTRAALVKHLQRGGDLQARAQCCFHQVRVCVHPLACLFLACSPMEGRRAGRTSLPNSPMCLWGNVSALSSMGQTLRHPAIEQQPQ